MEENKNEPSTMDMLLDEIKILKEDNANIRKELKEVKELNRSLLRGENSKQQSKDDVDAKFKKFLEGE